MHRRAVAGRPVSVLALTVLALPVAALSGCAGMTPLGSAAHSEAFTIHQSEVDEQVRAVSTQRQQPPGAPPAGLASATTERLVQDRLVAGLADELGVSVTQGQVDERIAELTAQFGGEAALEDAAAEAGIPADQIDEFVRTQLLQIGIAAESGPEGAGLEEALSEYSERIDLEVAPRYGRWDSTTLRIAAGSDVVKPEIPATSGSLG